MTTKPSDMKPSDRIRELAEAGESHPFLIGGDSKIEAIIAYLDERHAAGQGESDVIRATKGVTLPDGRYEIVEISERDDAPALRVGDSFRATSEAAGPGGYWQVLTYDESAKHAESTWVTAVRRVELPAPVAAPAANPKQCRCGSIGAYHYPGCGLYYSGSTPEGLPPDGSTPLLLEPNAPPAQPAPDILRSLSPEEFAALKPVDETEIRAALKRGADEVEAIRTGRAPAQPVAAEPAVPVAGEQLPSNPVEPETTRGQLQWGLDCVAGALGRPSLLVGEYAGAVVKVMAERDAALAQVEQLAKRITELEPAAGEPIWSRHNLLHELRERKVETTGLRKALTAANERAARLEGDNKELTLSDKDRRWREAALCKSVFASIRAGLALGSTLDEAIHTAELSFGVDGAPPPVATGERPIVVGSTWKNHGGGVSKVQRVSPATPCLPSQVEYLLHMPSSRKLRELSGPEFLRQHTWISDPPTPATGEQPKCSRCGDTGTLRGRDGYEDDCDNPHCPSPSPAPATGGEGEA